MAIPFTTNHYSVAIAEKADYRQITARVLGNLIGLTP